MGFRICSKRMVVIVIAAVACASLVRGSILEDDKKLSRKPSNDDESSQDLRERTTTESISSMKNLTTTTKHEKKMIHRLIGGHVKLYPKVTEAKDERETPPVAWDDGLMMSSAGNGKEKSSNRQEDEEEKKTLSQQVKEGKYGLIQNEIYSTPPKRPGIISYLGNPEVPKDTSKNLGGLEEDEIWLAENHLLVLRGGKFPDHGAKPAKNERKWPPIDDYEAPLRQVKIPPNPEVPPPFPVQLAEGGPVQIIRANGSAIDLNDTAEYDEYANYPEGFFPGEAPFYPFPPNTTDLGYPGNFSSENGSYLPPDGSLGPFYPPVPPGAVFLPPPNNQSDYDDEDQSIYYPPPYSFYYKQNNATPVPPGPLVPGIILPPPPNFFSSLDQEKKFAGKHRAERIETTTVRATTEPEEETVTYSTPTPRRKTPTKPYKVNFSMTTPVTPTFSTKTKSTTRIQPQTLKNIGIRTKSKNLTTVPPTIYTSTQSYVESTTSRPDKPTTITSDYYNVQTEIENHLIDLGAPQGGQWSGIVGTTAVPLLAYYATTSSPLERTRSTNENVGAVHVKSNGEDSRSKNQASYFYYEERNPGEVRTTTDSPAQVYFETTTEEPSAYYNVEPITSQRQGKKQYYSVEMIPSQQTADDYDAKLSSLIKTGENFGFDDRRLNNPSKYNVERIRTQSQGTLADNSQRYYQPVTVKPYFTTQRPRFYYQTSQSENYDYREEQQELKTNPVFRFGYETNDYLDKRPKEGYRGQEIREERIPATYNEYQSPPSTGDQYYDYETQHPVEKVPKPEDIPYLVSGSRPSYRPRNPSGIINATPNPQHAYYTKQDEQLLDDVTKQYFTIFGKKLPETILQSTTPLYRVVPTTTENPINAQNVNSYNSNRYVNPVQHFKPPKVKVHYGDQTQRPYSLEGDTLVNYKNPLPPINPDAEFIDVRNKPIANSHSQRDGFRTGAIIPSSIGNRPGGNYPGVPNHRETYPGRFTGPPISLANDIGVNYRDPRPPINPDAEFITPVIRGQQGGVHANRGGSYFAYQLPGNGGHFYFLTPQAISQRPEVNGAEYVYPKSTGQRIIRRRRIVTTSDG